MRGKRLLWFSVVILSARASIAAQAVGFTTPFDQAIVAARCRVPASTTAYGIAFFSNDATVFPEVALVSDAAGNGLPTMGATLRSVQAVAAHPGRNVVAFQPYWHTEGGFLWMVIRFPRQLITTQGPGGGAGVGWVRVPHALLQRSFYFVDGNIGEFTEGLDVTLITEPLAAVPKPTAPSGAVEPPAAGGEAILSLKPVASGPAGSVDIAFHLGAQGRVTLAVFDVAGRRVRMLLDATLPSGDHQRTWDGRDERGQRIARGVYLLQLQAHGRSVHDKVPLLR